MADQPKVRVSHLEEGHRGTSAPAPAIAATPQAVSAVPAASPAGSGSFEKGHRGPSASAPANVPTTDGLQSAVPPSPAPVSPAETSQASQ